MPTPLSRENSLALAACRRRDTCRACGGSRLHLFLSLGPQPLANAFLASEEDFASEAFYPLDVYFCETCGLAQLLDVVDPEVLFGRYLYTTGTSETIARHNREYAATLSALLGLDPRDLVVEIASNDGSLLKCFQRLPTRTLGIEPASNIAAMARAGGVETINRFFDSALAAEIRDRYGPARVVIANNVLAHVDDPRDFLAGMAALLGPDGLAVLEFPYGGELLDRLEYDTIYHEHLSYFCVTALTRLFRRASLAIVRIDRIPVHGGSLRIWASAARSQHAPLVEELARAEAQQGMTQFARYAEFARRVEANRRALRALLESLADAGKTLAGYGAPAKGNTLLNYCGIDASLLPYTVDKNPLKVGLFTPGMHIPVLPVEALLERLPDYVLILAWNFTAEILEQQRDYQRLGGRFLVPIPQPKVL